MKVIRGIDVPIAGERVLAVAPPLAPYTLAVNDVPTPRKRLNLFPQRALTHLALTGEQRSRIRDLACLTRAVAPGVITGLEVALGENVVLSQDVSSAIDRMIEIMPGRAVAPFGEDVELAYAQRVMAGAIPIEEQGLRARLGDGAADDELRQRWQDGKSVTVAVLREKARLNALPHALVLTAVPLTLAIDSTSEFDSPCENAVGEGAFSELAWEDGFELRWVPWPIDRALPLWSQDGQNLDPKFRNRLAYAVFNAERESGYGSWPWEQIGVPLVLIGFDRNFLPAFADRGAVSRQGGGRHNRANLVPRAGDDALWQARVAQLTEHLAELDPAERTADELSKRFDWLPPAGVLPKQVIDVKAGRQFVFPASFDVQAQPIPIDMVDALIEESSPLLPFNLSLRDQVQILVPVAARYFEADLLKLDERVHPLFDLEVRRLESARLLLLMRRDGLRRRVDVLSKAVNGAFPSYPEDDFNALPDETGALDAVAFARVHRSRADPLATEIHGFKDSDARLELNAADTLIVFAYLATPPAALRLQFFAESAQTDPAKRKQSPVLYFGESGVVDDAERVGALPAAGAWVRLEIPAARTGLASQKLDGIAFGMKAAAAAADVLWGSAGKLSNGFETLWVTDALPPGAKIDTTGAPWQWTAQGDPQLVATIDDEDAGLGLPVAGDVRGVAEVANLLSAYQGFAGGALMVELGSPGPGGNRANPRILDAGLNELISRLGQRIEAANDHVEFGFLRARTDIFRVRQSVLGTEQAGRLLTSPTASELITRNDNPVATEKEFADYFDRAKTATVPPAPAPRGSVPRTPVEGTAAPLAAAVSAPVAMAPPVETRSTFDALAGLWTKPGVSAPFVLSQGAGVKALGGAAGKDLLLRKEITAGAAESAAVIAGSRVGEVLVKAPAPSVGDVTGTSLFGSSLNTITVGERLGSSSAIVVQNAAVTGKGAFVESGSKLLLDKGFVMGDLQVYGFNDLANNPVSKVSDLAKLPAGTAKDTEIIKDTETDLHESEYFKRGLDAIDNMVRFLRGVEIRVEDYRRLQNDAMAARERIVAVLDGLSLRIADLSTQIAEVRHDLSVARALRAEEQARIDALIAKRKAILAEHVPYVVFRRPRFTQTLLNVPVRAAEPAVIEDLVPRCRADTHAVPPELQRMVDTLKDVPAKWLRRIHPLIEKFDRLDKVQNLMFAARDRLQRSEVRRVSLDGGEDTRSGQLLNAAFDRHGERMVMAMQESARGLSEFKADTWRGAVDAIKQIAAVGDLIGNGVADKAVTLEAAGELDDIAGVYELPLQRVLHGVAGGAPALGRTAVGVERRRESALSLRAARLRGRISGCRPHPVAADAAHGRLAVLAH